MRKVFILKLFNPHIGAIARFAMPALTAALLLTPAGTRAQPCTICDLVGRVDQASMARTIRDLSGEDSVLVGGKMELIGTRYTFSPQKWLAMQYLVDRASAYGYSPEVQRFAVSVASPELMGVAISQGNDSVWVGSIEGKIFLSTVADGWSGFDLTATIDGRVNELHMGSNGRLMAACKAKGSGYGKILSSIDGGLSWNVDKDGSQAGIYSLNTITFFDERFGFAAGDYGSFLNTGDGGRSWWVDAAPSQFSYRNLNGSAATGPVHFWVVADGGYLFESLDMGRNWSGRRLTTSRLADIDFHPSGRGVIAGDRVVFSTADGGGTWTQTAMAIDLRCVRMVDSLTALAAGSGGSLWMSEDGGVTWREAAEGCSGEKDIWRFAVGGDERVWTAGRNEISTVDPGWRTGEPACGLYEISDTTWGANVVFRREGWKDPGRRVILCGHYDSMNRAGDPLLCAPGADDNASGAACVLECARVLAGSALEKTVEFVLFDAEELGLVGSSRFAAGVDTGIVYEGIINLDMVGGDYGGTGDISLAAVDGTIDTILARRLLDSSEAYAIDYPLDWLYRSESDQPMSDNLAFKGFVDAPAVLLIESGFRDNPHYHNCTDLFEFVDMAYVRDVARTALGAAAAIAGYGAGPVLRVVLHQNFPNPFFSSTQIRFEIPERIKVGLSVYDAAGREVARLIDEFVEPDRYVYVWDGRNDSGAKVASGVYFLRLKAGGATLARKLVIVR